MTSLAIVIVTTALVNNVVLSQFLGLCSFLGVSKQIKTAASLGGAVIFVITRKAPGALVKKPMGW